MKSGILLLVAALMCTPAFAQINTDGLNTIPNIEIPQAQQPYQAPQAARPQCTYSDPIVSCPAGYEAYCPNTRRCFRTGLEAAAFCPADFEVALCSR